MAIGAARFRRKPAAGLPSAPSTLTAPRGHTLQSAAAQRFPDVIQAAQEESMSTLVSFTPAAGKRTMRPSNRSMRQQAHPIRGTDKMNTHLTIRTILAAGALAAVIGMTLSVARAGEVDAPSKTLGASGPPEPSPYVDYDNTWLTGTADWNAERAMGWRP